MALTQLFVNLTHPSGASNPFPIDTQRSFTISGTLTWSAGGRSPFSTSVNVTVGSSTTVFRARIVSTTPTSRNWTVDVQADEAVPPGTQLAVTVAAEALFTWQDGEGHNEQERPRATATFNVRLPAPIQPAVSIDNFASPIVASPLPLNFVFNGSASSVQTYIQRVQYKVEGGLLTNAVNVNGDWSRWRVRLPLPPGTHTLTIRATDRYGTFRDVSRTFAVQSATPIEVPAGARTTLAGVLTTSSVTSWTRLEPQNTQADIGTSSNARVFDPLWMLTRQWQMGEFQGEDAGTPVQARVRATYSKVSRARVGELPKPQGTQVTPVAGAAYDPASTPLEVIIERQRMRAADANDARMLSFAVESGLHFLRMLEQQTLTSNYRAAFIAKLVLQPIAADDMAAVDDAAARYLQSMVGRAPDGRVLASLLRTIGAAQLVADTALNIAMADRPKVQQAATTWLTWYDSLYSEPASASEDAWNPARFEYAMAVGARFSANAGDDLTFGATEIDGTPLDWSTFDVHPQAALTAAEDQNATSLVEATIPAPVSFPGSPSPRFWEMEDARTAYGLVPVGPTDIAHLLMIEYASTYGNDWFMVPLTLPVGSVTRVDSLVVTDSFGVRNLVRPIGDPALPAPHFSLWQSEYHYPKPGSTAKVVTNRFFLPPTLPRTLDGAPLEDVRFMRDEMANLAWAIERTVESPIEQPSQRYEQPDEVSPDAPDSASGTNDPRFLLSSRVPSNWIPFLPVQLPNPLAATTAGQVITRLKRGAILQPDGSRKVHSAVGEFLTSTAGLLLYDEEIPRSGVRITRRRRMTRWTDGSTWLWTALRNENGQGEGASGLQFDQVLEKHAHTPLLTR